jgi:hypothetical protein
MKIKFDTRELIDDKVAINIIKSLSDSLTNKTENVINLELQEINRNIEHQNYKLKKENEQLLDKIGELKSELDDLRYEYEKLKNENESNRDAINFQENKILELKNENDKLKNDLFNSEEEIDELKLVINEKDKFIEKEINSISKDTISSLNIQIDIENDDTKDTINIENDDTKIIDDFDVKEDDIKDTIIIEEDEDNDDKKRVIDEFEKLNNEEKEIINKLIEFSEITRQAKKDMYKYKIYSLNSHFEEYQDEYRKTEYKKATKKSTALFVLNKFDREFPESVDYIIKKEQIVITTNKKTNNAVDFFVAFLYSVFLYSSWYSLKCELNEYVLYFK